MKTSKILSVFLLLAAMVACSTNHSITISGHVAFPDPDMDMVLISMKGHVRDTIAAVSPDSDGNYKIKAVIDDPGVYLLDCGHWQSVSLWAEDEDMVIDFRGRDTARIIIKNPPFVAIRGSAKNEIMNDLNYNNHRSYQNMIAISRATYKAGISSAEDKSRISAELYDANEADRDARLRYLIEKYSGSTSVLAAIEQLHVIKDEELIESAMREVLAAHPGYRPAISMMEEISAKRERIRRMMPGQPAPPFTCTAADGSEIGPASFKGKILLIDFLASWCGPCRQEVPNLKKVYKQFRYQGVEIMSISIDSKEEAWRQALEEEKMEWPQAIASNNGVEVMELYQFSGIPFILLLDREGKIVSKNLRGEAVEKAIAELLAES